VIAALTAWWAASGGPPGDTAEYVTSTHVIGPGQTIEADDLRRVPMQLPDSLRSRAFGDQQGLVGSVALGPIGKGDLIQTSSVMPAGDTQPAARELTLSVDSTHAVAGTLRPGDRIDIFATYGDDTTSQTLRVMTEATVRRTGSAGGDGLGGEKAQTVTIGLGPGVDAAQIVNASRAATITIVRVTGTSGGDHGPARYRADQALETEAREEASEGGGEP